MFAPCCRFLFGYVLPLCKDVIIVPPQTINAFDNKQITRADLFHKPLILRTLKVFSRLSIVEDSLFRNLKGFNRGKLPVNSSSPGKRTKKECENIKAAIYISLFTYFFIDIFPNYGILYTKRGEGVRKNGVHCECNNQNHTDFHV